MRDNQERCGIAGMTVPSYLFCNSSTIIIIIETHISNVYHHNLFVMTKVANFSSLSVLCVHK